MASTPHCVWAVPNLSSLKLKGKTTGPQGPEFEAMGARWKLQFNPYNNEPNTDIKLICVRVPPNGKYNGKITFKCRETGWTLSPTWKFETNGASTYHEDFQPQSSFQQLSSLTIECVVGPNTEFAAWIKPKLAASVQDWLRAENMEEYVGHFEGEGMKMSDLVALDQENGLKQFLGLLDVPETAHKQIMSKVKALNEAMTENEDKDTKGALDKLEERIASTLMQIEKLKPADTELTQRQETVQQQIDDHFGDVTIKLTEERFRSVKKLNQSIKAKRAQIARNDEGLDQQLKAARSALAQCRNGQMGKDEILATVRKVLSDEFKIGMLDMPRGVLLNANTDGIDEFVSNFAEVYCVEHHPMPTISNIECKSIFSGKCTVAWTAALSETDANVKVETKVLMRVQRISDDEKDAIEPKTVVFDAQQSAYEAELDGFAFDTAYDMQILLFEQDGDRVERRPTSEALTFSFKTLRADQEVYWKDPKNDDSQSVEESNEAKTTDVEEVAADISESRFAKFVAMMDLKVSFVHIVAEMRSDGFEEALIAVVEQEQQRRDEEDKARAVREAKVAEEAEAEEKAESARKEAQLNESLERYTAKAEEVNAQKTLRYENGSLWVNVFRATNVDKLDKGDDDESYSDAFVKLEVNGQKQQTTIKKNTENPMWNQEFTFDLKEADIYKDVLTMTMMDHDRMLNDLVGIAQLPLINVVTAVGSQMKEQAFELKGSKTGCTLYIDARYTETE